MAQINKLTALQIKNAKPKDKEYCLNDGRGLYVRVYPNGTKSFYLQQIILGKRIKKNLGLVSEIKLEGARKIADEIIAKTKKIPAQFVLNKKSFKDAVTEYLEYQAPNWDAKRLHLFNLAYKRFFAKLENIALVEIQRKDILALLDSVIRQNHRKYFSSSGRPSAGRNLKSRLQIRIPARFGA